MNAFTIQPSVEQNPNPRAPLVALVRFGMNEPVSAIYKIDDGRNKPLVTYGPDHEPEKGLPVIGLRANTAHRITLTAGTGDIVELIYHPRSPTERYRNADLCHQNLSAPQYVGGVYHSKYPTRCTDPGHLDVPRSIRLYARLVFTGCPRREGRGDLVLQVGFAYRRRAPPCKQKPI